MISPKNGGSVDSIDHFWGECSSKVIFLWGVVGVDDTLFFLEVDTQIRSKCQNIDKKVCLEVNLTTHNRAIPCVS